MLECTNASVWLPKPLPIALADPPAMDVRYAPVVCHCPASAESYRNLNKIGVRGFILSGAPVNPESSGTFNGGGKECFQAAILCPHYVRKIDLVPPENHIPRSNDAIRKIGVATNFVAQPVLAARLWPIPE
jgi:hypothetical protein